MDSDIKKIIRKEKDALKSTSRLLKKDRKQDRKIEKLEKQGRKK